MKLGSELASYYGGTTYLIVLEYNHNNKACELRDNTPKPNKYSQISCYKSCGNPFHLPTME